MSHTMSSGAVRPRPSVILLNGCSGAGKTSIGHALQAALPVPHILTGTDDFLFKLLPRQWQGVPDGVQFRPMPDGSVPLHVGPGGLKLRRAFHHCVAAMVACDLSVIVDDVILTPDWLGDWLDVLTDVPVFFVGVQCDFGELIRREAARPDRAKGHMQTHFDSVHAHGDYDLVVDTTAMPAWRCAERVLAGIDMARGPSAFERLQAVSGAQMSG